MTSCFRSAAFVLTSALAAALPARAASALFDFEGQAIGTETPFSMSSGGITATFTGPTEVDPGAFGISSNFASSTGVQYRLMQGDFLTIGPAFGASGSALTITFSAPVSAVSLDFGLDDPAGASRLTLATDAGGRTVVAGVLVSGYLYPEGTLAYSGAAFDAITLASDAIDFQIDDLRVTAAVPEPGNAWLLGIGLPLLALVARRARAGRSA